MGAESVSLLEIMNKSVRGSERLHRVGFDRAVDENALEMNVDGPDKITESGFFLVRKDPSRSGG
jgi:hypothetical protein